MDTYIDDNNVSSDILDEEERQTIQELPFPNTLWTIYTSLGGSPLWIESLV